MKRSIAMLSLALSAGACLRRELPEVWSCETDSDCADRLECFERAGGHKRVSTGWLLHPRKRLRRAFGLCRLPVQGRRVSPGTIGGVRRVRLHRQRLRHVLHAGVRVRDQSRLRGFEMQAARVRAFDRVRDLRRLPPASTASARRAARRTPTAPSITAVTREPVFRSCARTAPNAGRTPIAESNAC